MFADEKQASEPPRGGPGASIGAEETDAVEWKFDEQIFTSSDFPEGRREDWLAVFGAWCLFFCTFGLLSWVFLDDYKKGPLAAYNPSAVSWITSLQTFVQTGGSALQYRCLPSKSPSSAAASPAPASPTASSTGPTTTPAPSTFTIYERDTEASSRGGYQIRLGAHALVGFRACLTERQYADCLRCFGRSGGVVSSAPAIFDTNMDLVLDLSKFPAYQKSAPVGRARLRGFLQEPLRARGVMRYGMKFTGFDVVDGETSDDESSRIRAYFEDGSSQDCDVLISAEGSGSRANRQVGLNNIIEDEPKMFAAAYLPDELRPSAGSTTAKGGLANAEKPSDYDEDQASLFVAMAWADGPSAVEASQIEDKKSLMRKMLQASGFHPDYLKLVDALDPQEIMAVPWRHSKANTPVDWRDRLVATGKNQSDPRIANPRVWLLGDSIHAMLPYRGMGANQAIHDIADALGPSSSLRERKRRTDETSQCGCLTPLAGTISSRAGFRKIQGCCDQARRDGLRWAWVDTCCIDKTSSAELSESINSMFKWYQRSDVCYTYLADVTVVPQSPPEWFAEADSSFRTSAWYTRGWTLQELIAPRQVRFYDGAWTIIGQMTEGSRLCEVVSEVMSIPPAFLCGAPLSRACVAKRMSWACARKTTWEEDIAYCLLGIFDVNMPLLYGEGPKAFYRLQEEIIRRTNDQTILAWGDLPSDGADSSNQAGPVSALADSPAAFRQCGDFERNTTFTGHQRTPFQCRNRGVQVRLRIYKLNISVNNASNIAANLDCFSWRRPTHCISIIIHPMTGGRFNHDYHVKRMKPNFTGSPNGTLYQRGNSSLIFTSYKQSSLRQYSRTVDMATRPEDIETGPADTIAERHSKTIQLDLPEGYEYVEMWQTANFKAEFGPTLPTDQPPTISININRERIIWGIAHKQRSKPSAFRMLHHIASVRVRPAAAIQSGRPGRRTERVSINGGRWPLLHAP
ncbi:hypothetical protein PG997_012886 [Apiospora hydei]|uniref:Heterokaryon incompatibility domain-containing protein n=1 Tax=Apiospora hydei TaxID=1337664 RepID=A0ABR1V7T7_9PEZI